MRALDQRRKPQNISGEATQTRKHKPDHWLLILMLGLLAIGLVVVYSISPALGVEKGVDGSQYVFRQVIAIGLGLVLFAAASQTPLKVWRRLSVPLLVIAGVATLMTLILPINA